jgi:hypothetical protein
LPPRFLGGGYHSCGLSNHIELLAFHVLSNEELNEFSAVNAIGPLFPMYDVNSLGDIEFTQAVFATDDAAAVFIQSR